MSVTSVRGRRNRRSRIALVVLGKPFFALCQSLQDAQSFSEVAEMISSQMPPLVGAEDLSFIVFDNDGMVDSIFGHGPIASRMRNKMEKTRLHAPGHPVMSRHDLWHPGELGFAVSDFMDPEEYRECEFNREVKGELASEDALFGRAVTSHDRQTLMTACRLQGTFSSTEREIFDVLLYTVRAVLEKIAGGNLEHQVMQYLLTTRTNAPNGFFLLKTNHEVLPLNNDAVQITESWWGVDEAVRELDMDTVLRIGNELHQAWEDPITARFKKVELDLGGGMMSIYAIQKINGEVIFILPIAGGPESMAGSELVAEVLTRRQREIMDWIAEGKTSAEVAIILDISPRTVEKHLEAVFQRLGVENRIAAVRRFLDLKAGQPV